MLFADVVRSMDLASTLDAERLREIMADLFDRSAAVVQRYGGTVDKFTGDGIMAVFGAPITLEDHAFRACLAALDIQKDVGTTLRSTNRPELRPGHRRRNRFQPQRVTPPSASRSAWPSGWSPSRHLAE